MEIYIYQWIIIIEIVCQYYGGDDQVGIWSIVKHTLVYFNVCKYKKKKIRAT